MGNYFPAIQEIIPKIGLLHGGTRHILDDNDNEM